MSLLRPTPSRRPWIRRAPLWTLVAGAALLALLAAGLILVLGFDGSSSDDASADASPTCTPVSAPRSTTPPEASEGGPVNVYNATERVGLAADTASLLADLGFELGDVENDPSGTTIAGTAEVRFGPEAEEQAHWVAAHVPGAELVELTREGPQVDLALGDAFGEVLDDGAARVAYADAATPAC